MKYPKAFEKYWTHSAAINYGYAIDGADSLKEIAYKAWKAGRRYQRLSFRDKMFYSGIY